MRPSAPGAAGACAAPLPSELRIATKRRACASRRTLFMRLTRTRWGRGGTRACKLASPWAAPCRGPRGPPLPPVGVAREPQGGRPAGGAMAARRRPRFVRAPHSRREEPGGCPTGRGEE
eukprot:358639-Chlamydomonas_euryale.AAC.2